MKKVVGIILISLLIVGCNKTKNTRQNSNLVSCYTINKDNSTNNVKKEVRNFEFTSESGTLSKIYYDEIYTIDNFKKLSKQQKENILDDYITTWCEEKYNTKDIHGVLSECNGKITEKGITIKLIYNKNYVNDTSKLTGYKNISSLREKLQKEGFNCEK